MKMVRLTDEQLELLKNLVDKTPLQGTRVEIAKSLALLNSTAEALSAAKDDG